MQKQIIGIFVCMLLISTVILPIVRTSVLTVYSLPPPISIDMIIEESIFRRSSVRDFSNEPVSVFVGGQQCLQPGAAFPSPENKLFHSPHCFGRGCGNRLLEHCRFFEGAALAGDAFPCHRPVGCFLGWVDASLGVQGRHL